MNSTAIFFPFDLFGSAGAANGAQLLSDAVEEMLDDNRRETKPTRAAAYQGKVRTRELSFETMPDYQDWRRRARQAIRQVFRKDDFLLWATGNHLGVLPVYEELSAQASETLVVQFDAHLDIYNLGDCTSELSHGNFLLHAEGPLPAIVNIGNRELLLRAEYIREHYEWTYPAAELAVDPAPGLQYVRQRSRKAARIFIDIDCDVFDPAYFPAVSHPLPFGMSPALLLRFLDAVWSERVIGVALSEFDPARDRNDQSLSTLVWLIEHLLLRRHEAQPLSAGGKEKSGVVERNPRLGRRREL
ncbi:MAG: arginase family protein [Gemmataceae bacterium]|nr:arginase family protein [Gemmataceae bacterium]